jgi:hypothetical protein
MNYNIITFFHQLNKFKNHKEAFKIGKANNIISKLKKLVDTQGEVVYLN